MTHSGSRFWQLLALGPLVALTVACGKKGPPLAPLRIVPARIEDLVLAKTGDDVRARFTIPSANDDKSQPADIVAVELYGLSGKPEDPFGQSLGGPDFLKFAQLVARLEVEPPPDPDRPLPEGAPLPPADPRPAQGDVVTIPETLDAADRQPFVHPRKKAVTPVEEREQVLLRPLTVPPLEDLFSRTYLVVGVNRKRQKGPPSNRVAVPLIGSPESPASVTIDHTETVANVLWGEPPGAWRRVQRPAEPTEIPARALVQNVAPTTYNVYAVTKREGVETVSPAPLNPAPLETLVFGDASVRLGEERCYQVRSVQSFGNARLESPATATTCKTLTDTFPPAAPKNLAAVGSEGGVSLIWEPNTEGDVAGYLVMRGVVPAEGATATLAPLMKDPLKETTWRDTTAKPGVRYVYAIVAVDGASPRNQSAESNRVEEGAR